MVETNLNSSLFKDEQQTDLDSDSDIDTDTIDKSSEYNDIFDTIHKSPIPDSESEYDSDINTNIPESEDVDLNKWQDVSNLSSTVYKPFEENHKDDFEQLKTAHSNGNLDNLMLKNTSDAWKETLENGIIELKNSMKKSNQSVVNDTIKNLNRALNNLNKITPQVKKPSVLANIWKHYKHKPTTPAPKPLCFDNEAICNKITTNARHDIKTLLQNYNDSTLEEYKCCVKIVYFDTSFVDQDYRMVFNLLDSLDTLVLNYNSKQPVLMNVIPEKVRKQITTIELLDSPEEKSVYIPFDYQSVFPSLVEYQGVYTSPFSYIFKYITDAILWIDNSETSQYFDINDIRLLQFINLPNIENLHLKNLANSSDSGVIYNLYINKLPKLVTFEDTLDIVYDTLRIHNVPKCEYLQSKMIANKIDLNNIGKILSLDLIAREFVSIINLPKLKTLSIKLDQEDAKVKLIRLPALETLMVSGNLSLGNTNQNVIIDCASIHNLQTFIIEGTITASTSTIIDNFIHEIINNNKSLSHININGISITGPKLYQQYKTFLQPSLHRLFLEAV